MDAAGADRATIYGWSEGGAMSLMFAATYPERVRALVLYAPAAKTVRSADWPFGRTEEEQHVFYQRFTTEMGTGENLDLQGPSHDPSLKRWWARFERLVATPGAYRELARIFSDLDIRAVLPAIRAPTLVLSRTGDRITARFSEFTSGTSDDNEVRPSAWAAATTARDTTVKIRTRPSTGLRNGTSSPTKNRSEIQLPPGLSRSLATMSRRLDVNFRQ